MAVGAFVVLVVLATSSINAHPHPHPTSNYDLDDCRNRTVAMGTHHANEPDNCRVFYNCDNAYGGKLTHCPEGTVYNATVGLCLHSGGCDSWHNHYCTHTNVGTAKIAGQCCNTYFQYDCATRTVSFHQCQAGYWFNPAQGACSTQQPAHCHVCKPSSGQGCNDSALEYVGPCRIKLKGQSEQPVAAGTKVDQHLCTIVHDTDNTCPTTPIPRQDCGTKYTLSFRTLQFVKDLAINSHEGHHMMAGHAVVPLYQLQGQDLGYTPFALRLAVTLHHSHPAGEVPILTTKKCGTQTAESLVLEVKVIGTNAVGVGLRRGSERVDLQGSVNAVSGREVVVVVIFDLAKAEVKGQVNGQTMHALGTSNLRPWKNGASVLACLWQVNNFDGDVTNLSYRRNCVDFGQMSA